MMENILKPVLKNKAEKQPEKVTVTGKHNLLSPKCLDFLQFRIKEEEYSARIYLAMSLWLENEGYINAPKVWRRYSEEELKHAEWARTYLLSLGILPLTDELKRPQIEFVDFPEIIDLTYDHEMEVTKQCNELATEAFKESDHMLYALAAKYLNEQIEELNKAQMHKDQMKTFGTDKIALRLYDHELEKYV